MSYNEVTKSYPYTIKLYDVLGGGYDLFDFDYDLTPEMDKLKLEDRFVSYYYLRDIAHEHQNIFLHRLEEKWKRQVELYNRKWSYYFSEIEPLIISKVVESEITERDRVVDELINKIGVRSKVIQDILNKSDTTDVNTTGKRTSSNTLSDNLTVDESVEGTVETAYDDLPVTNTIYTNMTSGRELEDSNVSTGRSEGRDTESETVEDVNNTEQRTLVGVDTRNEDVTENDEEDETKNVKEEDGIDRQLTREVTGGYERLFDYIDKMYDLTQEFIESFNNLFFGLY